MGTRRRGSAATCGHAELRVMHRNGSDRRGRSPRRGAPGGWNRDRAQGRVDRSELEVSMKSIPSESLRRGEDARAAIRRTSPDSDIPGIPVDVLLGPWLASRSHSRGHAAIRTRRAQGRHQGAPGDEAGSAQAGNHGPVRVMLAPGEARLRSNTARPGVAPLPPDRPGRRAWPDRRIGHPRGGHCASGPQPGRNRAATG
jgi:hypothetical protein